jgi:hypothetical protein
VKIKKFFEKQGTFLPVFRQRDLARLDGLR